MDLITTDKNVRGHNILVGGHGYPVDKDGIARGVSDADADELLTSTTWKLYVPGAVAPPAVRVPVKPPVMGLITGSGSVIPKPPESPPYIEPHEGSSDSGTVIDPPVSIPKDGGGGGGLPAEETNNSSDAPVANTVLTEPQPMYGQWPLPAPGADWPDPVAAMPIEYLKLMADAYGVRYAPNIGEAAKAAFVERIEKAMYETTPATTG